MGYQAQKMYDIGMREMTEKGIWGCSNTGNDYCYACYGFVGSVPDYQWVLNPNGEQKTCAECGHTAIVSKREP